MKKRLITAMLVVAILLISIMPVFAAFNTITMKPGDGQSFVLRAVPGATTAITIQYTYLQGSTHIEVEKIAQEYPSGRYYATGVGIIKLNQTVTLKENEIFGLANITGGQVTITYDNVYVNKINSPLGTYVDGYNDEVITPTVTYIKIAGHPNSPVSLEDYPYQVVAGTVGDIGMVIQKLVVSKEPMWFTSQRVYGTQDLKYFSWQMQSGVPTWVSDGVQTGANGVSVYGSSVIACNQPVYTSSAKTTVYQNPVNTTNQATGGNHGGLGTSFETDGTVMFLMPSEGYADNTNLMVFMVSTVMPLPNNPDKSKLAYTVTGGVAGTGDYELNTVTQEGANWKGLLKFTRMLYPGENTVTVSVKYDGSFIGGATIHVTYYDDFIDENNDGLDDRTGNPPAEYNPPDDVEPDRSSYPEGILGSVQYGFDKLMYYVKQPFIMIAEGLTGVVEFLGLVVTKSGNVVILLGKLFEFLPVEVRTLIGGTFTVIMIATVKKYMGK